MMASIKFQCLYKDHVFTDNERAARLENASVIYGWFTEVANKCGYAIARHGSGVRDIDLVAIPWTEEAVSATELVCKLAATFTITLGNYGYDKPHGRAAFSMWHHRWPDQQIDLSVMPLRPTPSRAHGTEKESE